MYLVYGLIILANYFLPGASDHGRKNSANEIVRGQQSGRAAGGIGCRAAPDALSIFGSD